MTDGPFTEAKEIIGGYALVEMESKDEALRMARQFMDLHRVHWPAFEGECEVRPTKKAGSEAKSDPDRGHRTVLRP